MIQINTKTSHPEKLKCFGSKQSKDREAARGDATNLLI